MHHSKLPAIIAQLLDIQSQGKVQVFISFSGHVNKVEVDIHTTEWEPGKSADLSFGAYVDSNLNWEIFEKQVDSFIKLYNALNQ